MKTLNIILQSKNKISMNNFLFYLKYITKFSLNILKKFLKKKIKKKKLTILTSPHINKKAQEQFETRFLKKKITIQITKNFGYLVFLKNLNFNLFPDIKLKIVSIAKNKKNYNLNDYKVFKYRNFEICNLNLNQLKIKFFMPKHFLIVKTYYLLIVFDLYELLFKKSLNSSVVEQKTENLWVDSSNLFSSVK